MLAVERPEFERHLAIMFGAWNRVLSTDAKEGYWKGCEFMQLSDFVRAMDKAIVRLRDDPETALPNVGALWSIKRSLRAKAPAEAEKPEDDGWKGDGWDRMANLHLFAYLLKHVQKGKRYHPDAVYSASQRTFIPGGEGKKRAEILVRWKNEWASIMRGSPQNDHGKALWAECMGAAEEQISAAT